MLRGLGRLALCACVCALLLSTAPFDQLATDSTVPQHLAGYQAQGLLGELELPAEGISRLEAALLVRRALEAYAERQLAGAAPDSAVQTDLQADCAELQAELELLGVKPPAVAAGLAPAAGSAPAPVDRMCPDCGLPVEECAAPASEPEADPCAAPELKLTPYGDIALQLRAGRTAIASGGNLDTSDLTVYWGEIGADAEYGQLRAHASVLLNTGDAAVDLHEAYGEWRDTAGRWALRGGRIVQPLGVRDTIFPSYSAASDLVYTTANAVGGEIAGGGARLTAYAFNPQVEVAGQNDTLSDYSLSLELSDAGDATADHYTLAAGYTSNVAASDIALAGPGPLTDRTAAGSLLAEYVWGCGRHRAVAEYSWAFDALAAADLDANADGAGDQPAALNLEYVHTTASAAEYGVRYERTSQFADYAESRWGVMYGQRLNPFATFRVELSRGEFGDYSTVDAETDTQLNAELRVVF